MIRWIKQALLYGFGLIVAVAAISYVVDYAVFRYRVSAQKNAFGQVTVTVYYASHLKNGNIEYDVQPPQPQPCTNSLYPHMGMQPCWYLNRHHEQRIEISN